MTIKNRYIFVESTSESELVQTLLFEAGAGWKYSGKSLIPFSDCFLVIDEELVMSVFSFIPDGYKELSLLQLASTVRRDASVEKDNIVYICEVVDNHINFEGTEVSLTPDELSEVLRIIQALPNRDAVLTIRDEDTEDTVFPLTNLSIEFI